MAFRLYSDLHNGYAQNYELKPALGYGPGHYPDEHREHSWMGRDNYGATTEIKLVLLSKAEAKALHPRSSKPRRLHAECPNCHRLVCAGHTVQHKCKV